MMDVANFAVGLFSFMKLPLLLFVTLSIYATRKYEIYIGKSLNSTFGSCGRTSRSFERKRNKI